MKNSSLNKKISIFAVFIVLIISIIAFFDYRKRLVMTVDNIFSEMYDKQKNGIILSAYEYGIHINSERDGDGFRHSYYYKYVDSENSTISVTITKKSKFLEKNSNPNVYILIGQPLASGILYAKFDYNPETKILKRSLDYSDSNPENNLTTKEVLEKSTSSPNHYTDIATTILKKKFLTIGVQLMIVHIHQTIGENLKWKNGKWNSYSMKVIDITSVVKI